LSGERDLQRLLAELAPTLGEIEYAFVSRPDARYGDGAEFEPVAACREAEGWTLVVPRAVADRHGLDYTGAFRCISLGVHSSLHAVGLTAAVAARLTEHDISANVIAGFHHDHIFVPAERARDALTLLAGNQRGEHSR